MIDVLLFIAAFIIGFLAAIMGIGGGIFNVPLLNLFLGLDIHRATGTSLLIVLITDTSSTLAYARQRRISYRLGLLMGLSSIPLSALGGYLTLLLDKRAIESFFGAYLMFTAFRMLFRNRLEHGANKVRHCFKEASKRVIAYPFIGAFSGLTSGILGIGGGLIIVPALSILTSTPIHIAIATSAFTILFTATPGAITRLYIGHVLLNIALLMGLGAALGAQLGAYTVKRLRPKSLRIFFGAFLATIGLRYIFSYIVA